MLDPNCHNDIILYVLFTASTRWIPLPLADQIAANELRRRLLEKLAEHHRIALGRPALKVLADEDIGCLYGCIFGVLFFPRKYLLGKILLLIRFMRFVDELSNHYHAARLAEYVFRTGLLAPTGNVSPERLRSAIDAVCAAAPIGPVGAAFRRTLASRQGLLRDIAGLLKRALHGLRGKRTEDSVKAALQAAETQNHGNAWSLIAPLRAALDEIPPEHFQRLEAQLEAHLKSGTDTRSA